MSTVDYLSTLTQAERKALSVCGIVKTEQLCNISLNTLMNEMKMASDFFKDDVICINRERLEEIVRAAHEHKNIPVEEDSLIPAREVPTITEDEFENEIIYIYEDDDLTKEITIEEAVEDSHHRRKSSGAIRNTRPHRTYISAFLFILLYASIVYFIVTAFRFIIGVDDALMLAISSAVLLTGLMLYFFFARKTTCPVCSHRIYTFHSFNFNRSAHKLPLLSCSLSTALHIFFFFWFRCPACGTPQKIIGKKRR